MFAHSKDAHTVHSQRRDFDSLPIAFHVTEGEVSDCTQLKISLDMGRDIKQCAAPVGDGYDSEVNRAACHKLGIIPVIPQRSNAKDRSNSSQSTSRKPARALSRLWENIKTSSLSRWSARKRDKLRGIHRFCFHHGLAQMRPHSLIIPRTLYIKTLFTAFA